MTASDIFALTVGFIFALLLLGGLLTLIGGLLTLIKLAASWLRTRWRMVKYRAKGRKLKNNNSYLLD